MKYIANLSDQWNVEQLIKARLLVINCPHGVYVTYLKSEKGHEGEWDAKYE